MTDWLDYDNGRVRLACGDCLTILPELESGSVDTLIVDPPYKIDVNKRNKGSGFYKGRNHLSKIDESFGTNHKPFKFLKAFLRICRGNILIWHSQALLKTHLDFCEKNNRKWDLMFWHKTNSIPAHYNHLMNDTEYCTIIRSKSFTNGLEYDDYHKYHLEGVQHDNGHPTPKPINLMMKQISLFSRIEDIVMDPMMGSGTTGVAAIKLGRCFVGIEIDPTYFAIAQKRIEQALAQPALIQV